MLNWRRYLESLCTTYAQWWQVYTITDVVGHHRVEAEPSPLLFDFGLMVQTVERDREERGKAEEKIERLSVLEGLRKYASEHVLLVGRPGSGKSTALARLLLEEAERAREGKGETGEASGRSPLNPPLKRGEEIPFAVPLESGEKMPLAPSLEKGEKTSLTPPFLRGAGGDLPKIPVLVELRYYRTSILDLIQDFLQRHDPNLTVDAETLKTWLRQGQLLLLLDGVNELPSEEARRDLQKFRQDYQKTTPMIFTTRDLGVGGDLDIAKKLEMQPLSEAQMQQFVRAYLRQQGEQMLRQLGSRLREFGQTPLLLMMLCSVFADNRYKIPSNLGSVFRRFTQIYTNKLKQDIPISKESRRWWHRLLEQLAWVMTSGEEKTELQVAIPKQKAEAVLTQFLAGKVAHPEDCALCWLEDLRKHHLIQRGAGDQIEFRHQLIQEYYTAECLLKLLPSLSEDELKREYLNYLKWTEPLALMLELVEDEAQAVRVVKLALEVDLRLGARLAGAVKPEWQEQTVGLVTGLEIPQLLKIQLLSLTQSEKIIPELVKALNHEDSDVRWMAVKALGDVNSSAAILALVKVLNHEDSDVRWMAVEALGDVNSSAAILALVKALDDKDYFVHRDAVEALVNLCSKTQEERLDDYINSIRKFRQIEPYYLHPLGFQCYHGSNAALEGLVNDLNHEDSSVRRDAAHTLGRIGSQVSAEMFSSGSYLVIGGFVNAAVIEELFGALNHEDCYVRWSTADALVNIGLQLTIKVQFEIFDYEDYCVFDFGSTGVIEELVGALNHEDCYVRWSAIKWLVNVLTDENYHARGKAAKALRKIGLELAIPGLVNALEHEDSSVRGKAAKALRKIGLESAIPGLVNALKHEDSSVRGKAAKALEEIASPEVLPDLSECLKTDKTTKLLNTISAIQEHCKFYNYTLTHPSSPPVSGKSKPKNSSTKPKSISLMHILHLSDLHFGTLDQANLWSNQLTEDLQNDRNISHLDALILSGDIANYSTETEYNAAKEFINELAREFQIRRSHIIIVPGNHDLNWELGDKAFSYDENGLPKRDMTQHQRRFDYFRNFYQAIKAEAYPLEYEHQGIVYHLPKQKLLILGLNSAWKLDRFQKTDANINDQALTNALKKIRDNQDLYEGCVKIAVWHHPLNSSGEDRIKDQGFMERLAQNGFRLALHGHVHTAKKDLFNYDYTSNTSDRKLDIICAGTFGAPTKELVTGYPWQYNLLKIADNNLTVYTRRREELNGAWKPDARWLQGAGQEPLSYYAIEL